MQGLASHDPCRTLRASARQELNFEEARKLEERRAQRLGDPEQLFATLIAGGPQGGGAERTALQG